MKKHYESYKAFCDEFHDDIVFGEVEVVPDHRVAWGLEGDPTEVFGYTIQLPHQCDEWVVGSKEDAQSLIKSLTSAIEWIDANPLED